VEWLGGEAFLVEVIADHRELVALVRTSDGRVELNSGSGSQPEPLVYCLSIVEVQLREEVLVPSVGWLAFP